MKNPPQHFHEFFGQSFTFLCTKNFRPQRENFVKNNGEKYTNYYLTTFFSKFIEIYEIHGGFHLVDLIIMELKDHMTCYYFK